MIFIKYVLLVNRILAQVKKKSPGAGFQLAR